MRSTTAARALVFLSAFLPQLGHSYKLIFYAGQGCRGQALGNIVTGTTGDECKRDMSGNAGSVMIKSTGPVDNNFMLATFDSDDCNPDHVVEYGDELDGCLDKGYKGFQVVDMSLVE